MTETMLRSDRVHIGGGAYHDVSTGFFTRIKDSEKNPDEVEYVKNKKKNAGRIRTHKR